MNAVAVEAIPQTLISQYATPEEITAVREKFEQIDLAESDLRHIATAILGVERQRTAFHYRTADRSRHLAAVALGEAPTDAPMAHGHGPSESELEMQARGLETRRVEAQGAVDAAKGAFRAAVHRLLKECAHRCSADYLDLTRRQGWCHQQIAIAHILLGGQLVSDAVWMRYFVPGSESLPALRGKSREEWNLTALMSSDRLAQSRDAEMKTLEAEGTRLLGSWPL